jgi:lipopolysaccharide heptosyltransferase I
MRILIVKLSSIGDIVHTLPAAAAIKRELPDAKLFWVAERGSAEILRNNPILEGLIEIDTKALRGGKAVLGKTWETAYRQFRELRASELDLSIDFQGLLKSASLAKFSGIKKRFGFNKENLREPASRILLTDTVKVRSRQNVVLKNIELAEAALARVLDDPDFTLDRCSLAFPIGTSEADKKEALDVASRAGGKFAVINPGGGWVTKLWHEEKYGRLADLLYSELGVVPVLVTGPGEEDLAASVLAASRSGSIVDASVGLKGFYELAALAEVYVGGDTGPTHLAVAAGCPIVGIFGPTEWWRNGSNAPLDVGVGRDDIECRIDCHRRTCDKWICMDIPVETVFEAVVERLEQPRIPAV